MAPGGDGARRWPETVVFRCAQREGQGQVGEDGVDLQRGDGNRWADARERRLVRMARREMGERRLENIVSRLLSTSQGDS